MARRNQSPHYIPELDPENNEDTAPERTIRALLLEWHTWAVLLIGAAPAIVGVFSDDLPDWTRVKLIAIGAALSFFLVLLFVATNRPKQ